MSLWVLKSSTASLIDGIVSALGIPQYFGNPSLATDDNAIRIKLEIDNPVQYPLGLTLEMSTPILKCRISPV